MVQTSSVSGSHRASASRLLLFFTAGAVACSVEPRAPDQGRVAPPAVSTIASSEVVITPRLSETSVPASTAASSSPPASSSAAAADPTTDAAAPSPPKDGPSEKLVARPAPDFNLPRVGAPKEKVALRGLRGKVVVLFFFATWAAPAEKAFIALSGLRRQVKNEKRLAVVGVSVDEDLNDVVPFASTKSMGAPIVHDADTTLTQRFAVRAIPATYLIDRAGAVRLVQNGFSAENVESLKAKIDELAK